MANETKEPKEEVQEEPGLDIVGVQEVKSKDDNFLDQIVEQGSSSGNLGSQSIRYLKNNGTPTPMVINTQRHAHWRDKDGKQRVIEIVVDGRDTSGDGKEEQRKAEQLRLKGGEKAILYYQPDGRIVSKILGVNESFTVENYPHVLGVTFGEGEGDFTAKRRYNILVGQIAAVKNNQDFETLWKTFRFCDEVDEKGKVVRENDWSKTRKNPPQPTDKPMPSSFGTLSDGEIKRAQADKNYQPNTLQEGEAPGDEEA
jgi:hypothetical protein